MIQSSLFDEKRERPVSRGAILSPCNLYRYSLTRVLNAHGPRLCFIMLNPSVADHTRDDPTTRRVMGYVTEHDFGVYEAVNLFAMRSPFPKDLRKVADPVGPENDKHLVRAVTHADTVVVAWGNHGFFKDRARLVVDELLKGLKPLWCLGYNKTGAPVFPLYVKAPWNLELFKTK